MPSMSFGGGAFPYTYTALDTACLFMHVHAKYLSGHWVTDFASNNVSSVWHVDLFETDTCLPAKREILPSRYAHSDENKNH